PRPRFAAGLVDRRRPATAADANKSPRTRVSCPPNDCRQRNPAIPRRRRVRPRLLFKAQALVRRTPKPLLLAEMVQPRLHYRRCGPNGECRYACPRSEKAGKSALAILVPGDRAIDEP